MGVEKSLKDLLKQRYGNIYTVHRLDRDAIGIIIFNTKIYKALSLLLKVGKWKNFSRISERTNDEHQW